MKVQHLLQFCADVSETKGKLTLSALFLQDNPPAHIAQVSMAAAIECGFKVLYHPTYSPDLAPFDC